MVSEASAAKVHPAIANGASGGLGADVAPGRPDDGFDVFWQVIEQQVAVPEPASFSLLAAGLIGLGRLRRRR